MSKQSTSNTVSIDPNTIVQDVLFSPIGAGLGLVLVLCVAAKWQRKKTENILARGQLATVDHKENARLKAIRLIERQKFNDVGCYLGTPKGTILHRANGVGSLTIGEDRDRVYLECTGGTYILGINGSGKTFGCGMPQLRSWVDQGCGSKKGFPIAFYDIKFSMHSTDQASPSAELAGYAKARGYRVHVLAPGVCPSKIPDWATVGALNLLDFVRSHEDVEMARQLVMVLLKNLVPGFEKMTAFFRDGCVSALQGLILLAKMTDKPDLLTCRQLLLNPNLLQIIQHPSVPQSVRMVFDTYLKAAADPETLSGIDATMTNGLAAILMPAIAPSICGKTTVPLDLDGNDLLIFGVDGERRDVVIPILAAMIHCHVNRNLLRPRSTPYGLSLDEVGSIFLPDLDEWPNQYRSAGLILQVAAQSPEIVAKRYGKEGAARIAKGCANHLIFQVDYDDAKTYAQQVGQTDIVFEANSNSSGKNGNSQSTSDQRQKIDLLEAHELVTAPQGRALIITRSTGDANAARVPYMQQIVIPQWDIDAVRHSVKLWDNGLTRPATELRFTDKDFDERTSAILRAFPLAEVENPAMPNTLSQSESQALTDDVTRFLSIKEKEHAAAK